MTVHPKREISVELRRAAPLFNKKLETSLTCNDANASWFLAFTPCNLRVLRASVALVAVP